ncbi:MAG: molybdopterin-dependent oxidoreductase, partial [Eubacteriales bacterium]|nr:molybdopterin-dependent oxidoreductase [Eubacteriales bacterium]
MSQYGESKRNFKYLNQSMTRVDSLDKATGRANYAADLSFPDMLVAGALHSPYASARVIRIDTTKAEAMPGVVAVMTFKDLKKPVSWAYYYYMTERIRYEGDAVAIVAAENEQALRAGLCAIEVEFEPLQPVLTIDEALAPGAPLVHEGNPECAGNIWSHASAFVRKGDVEEAFSHCDKIVERSYSTSQVEHAYMETEAAVAVPDKNGRMTVYAGCANPFFGRHWAADACNLPRAKTRLIQTTVGGSFGGKEELAGLVIGRAAMLAQRTGRAVKYVTSREESIKCSTKRHPFKLEYKVGVNRDGRLQAVQCKITETCGAYHMHEWMSFRTKIHAAG